ncbi:prevent-host-death protein [candidate division KSB1 bacterium RBG_16_48_16]|nr:MAG: prevent-host-death protein [candidate division KSB1 bacterium RBG_16_48_16]
MKFLTVRELRNKSSQIWKELQDEQEMVITNNGRPVAILSSINENNFEVSLNSIRRARAIEAMSSLQKESINQRTNEISLDEINQEIKAARKSLNK